MIFSNKISIKIASTAEDFDIVRDFRVKFLRNGSHHDPVYNQQETKRDKESVVFLFIKKGSPVGTLRATPIGRNLSVIEEKAHLFPSFNPEENCAWELGRLIVIPEHRKFTTIKSCLNQSLKWFKENYDGLHFYATCHPKLFPLYKKWNFRQISQEANNSSLLIQSVVSNCI